MNPEVMSTDLMAPGQRGDARLHFELRWLEENERGLVFLYEHICDFLARTGFPLLDRSTFPKFCNLVFELSSHSGSHGSRLAVFSDFADDACESDDGGDECHADEE